MAYVSLSVNVTIINPIKVAGFESKERLRSSEIKEDGLCFVERSSTLSKSLVLRAKNGYVARKLKKMAYVSLSVNVTIINPIKVAGFESKEWLCSSEIKEAGLRFVERSSQPYQSRWF